MSPITCLKIKQFHSIEEICSGVGVTHCIISHFARATISRNLLYILGTQHLSKMNFSRPGVEGKLLIFLFLLCVRNVYAKAQISFGGNTPKTKVTVEVGARTGGDSQKKQGARAGLLADILGI